MRQNRNREDAKKALISAIEGIGIGKGDTVFLGIDMGKIPLPYIEFSLSKSAIKKRNRELCEFVYETIKDVIGEKGTIIVPTYSYTCARDGAIYIHEKTPSEVGPFTEYVRCLPESNRSIHPIFSVCAIGSRATELTTNCGGSAFGICSPFARLSSHGCKFLNLGIPFHGSLTYVHHIEQSYGCNHRYNKALRTKVIVNDKEVMRQFTAYLRFRGVKADVSLVRMEQLLRSQGALRELKTNEAIFQSALAADIDKLSYSALIQDPTFFLDSQVAIYLDDSLIFNHSIDAKDINFKLDVI